MDAADVIMDAYASSRSISPLSDTDPTLNEARAYAIAAEIHARRVANGERPVGRKIGFTNRTIWELYGVDTPIWGYVYDTTVHEAPTTAFELDVRHLIEPRIEPEIQLHFARTPPVTKDEDAILACIDWMAHGFEIVQSPFPGWRFKREDTIAACSLHGALVVGPKVPVSSIDGAVEALRSFTLTLAKDGVVEARGGGANVLDSPLLAFAHLAAVLDTRQAVTAGEIVTTGTLTDAYAVCSGETWSTELAGIDLPGMSVTFTNT